jgi:hypothetical protein
MQYPVLGQVELLQVSLGGLAGKQNILWGQAQVLGQGAKLVGGVRAAASAT